MPSFPESRALMIGLLAAGGLSLSACDSQSPATEQEQQTADAPPPPPPPHPALSGTVDIQSRGEAAPDIAFMAPDGSEVKLSDFKGKPLLVNLWATWCAPCKAEMPTLDTLAGQEERLQVLVVSEDQQGRAVVDPFFAENDFKNLRPYTDTGSELGLHYRTGVMPTTILYDAEGKEVWRVLGGMNWAGAKVAAMLEDTLAESGG